MGYCTTCGEPMIEGRCVKCGGTSQVTGHVGGPPRDDPSMKYLPSAFSTQGIGSGLRRMVGEEVTSQPCAECQTSVAEDMRRGADGRPLCLACWSKECDVCAGCGRPITLGRLVKTEGKSYHETCNTAEMRCEVCGKPMFGEVVSALGKHFHPACFCCGSCQKQLDAGFVEHKGKPFCKACVDAHHERVAAQPSQRAVDSTRSAQAAQYGGVSTVPQDVYRQVQEGKGRCTGCGEVFGALDSYVRAGGQDYHDRCFVCASCGRPFPDGAFVEKAGRPYHASCWTTTHAERCGGCGRPIEGTFLKVGAIVFHQGCFKCNQCGVPLTSSYVEKDGKYVCTNCATPTVRTTTTTVRQTGGAPGGFTVDPMTGEKRYR